MPMTATLLAALLSTAPVLAMSEPQLDAQIADAHRLPLPARIGKLSSLFVGIPYGEFPLGDDIGPEKGPRWRVDAVDCQTYVETVLAMANARSLGQARSVLDDIRYKGPPASFANRNHFTEAQWLPTNMAKGYLVDEVPRIQKRAPVETLTLKRDEWTKVAGLRRLAEAEIPEGTFEVRYVPLDKAEARVKSIAAGSILMVVREASERVVRISHMGFVVDTPKGRVVRHASSGQEHAVIDEPFAAFVERQREYKKWKVVGFAVALPLDASARVAQLQMARR
jgi:hypothetical protein